MLISQIVNAAGMIEVVARDDGAARIVTGAGSVYALALEAARGGVRLTELIERKGLAVNRDLLTDLVLFPSAGSCISDNGKVERVLLVRQSKVLRGAEKRRGSNCTHQRSAFHAAGTASFM